MVTVSSACGGAGLGPFASPRYAGHPLVGTVWARTADGTLVPATAADWIAGMGEARIVLLGEVHDNADHHRLQARFVARLAAGPRPPAVAFEMLDASRQAAIDAFLAGAGGDADRFAARVDWAGSGWPDFALYRPLFAAVLGARLPVLAAGLPRGEELPPDAPERAPRLGLAEPLPPDEQAARIEEMFAAHCELMPRDHLAPLVEMQRARDARLALALLRGVDARGRAVLVAGNGHVREGDVPALLRRAGVPRSDVRSLGLLEVEPGQLEPPTEAAGFDFTILTPAAEREDPCEGLRRRLARPHREGG